ncbi:MAG: hemolysin III family protein [Planctomycetes bacterium]|nr:hemolysin III family protein [Planctomycetota bacterium]
MRKPGHKSGVFIDYPPELSPADELANRVTHGLGAVASVGGAVWLIATASRLGDPLMTTACVAYVVSLIMVFTASTLSHWVERPRWRHLFRTIDQASIYLLTAGSCSPFFVRYLVPHGWGFMLPLMWGLALYAAWVKLSGHRVNSHSVLFNVVLGWLPMIAAQPLLTHMPAGCIGLVLLMGTLYMLGVVFLCQDNRRQYFHAIWHTLVVAASACTFAAIMIYVIAP